MIDTPTSHMKYLKSSSQDLRVLFEHSITIKHIAEPLASFDSGVAAAEARRFMDEKMYDVVGVREAGLVLGYACKTELRDGHLGLYRHSFRAEECQPEYAPLGTAVRAIQQYGRVYVLVFSRVAGIVTRGDLQKVPVRLWLFGLTSLLEMHLQRLIAGYYPEDSWLQLLTGDQRRDVKKCFRQRQEANAETELVECLYFKTKMEILLQTPELLSTVWLDAGGDAETVLRRVVDLRNKVCHPTKIDVENWYSDLAGQIERVLQNCEAITAKSGTTDMTETYVMQPTV